MQYFRLSDKAQLWELTCSTLVFDVPYLLVLHSNFVYKGLLFILYIQIYYLRNK